MPLPQSSELAVSTLGPCRFPSPLRERAHQFVDEWSNNKVAVFRDDEIDLPPALKQDRLIQYLGAVFNLYFAELDLP